MHGVSNRDTNLYPPHNNSSVYLTTTTYVRRSGRITNGRRSGWTTLYETPYIHSQHRHPSTWNDLSRTAWVWLNCLRTGVGRSVPACTAGVWPPLRPVSVAQKNKPSTILSSNVQSIDVFMDYTA